MKLTAKNLLKEVRQLKKLASQPRIGQVWSMKKMPKRPGSFTYHGKVEVVGFRGGPRGKEILVKSLTHPNIRQAIINMPLVSFLGSYKPLQKQATSGLWWEDNSLQKEFTDKVKKQHSVGRATFRKGLFNGTVVGDGYIKGVYANFKKGYVGIRTIGGEDQERFKVKNEAQQDMKSALSSLESLFYRLRSEEIDFSDWY